MPPPSFSTSSQSLSIPLVHSRPSSEIIPQPSHSFIGFWVPRSPLGDVTAEFCSSCVSITITHAPGRQDMTQPICLTSSLFPAIDGGTNGRRNAAFPCVVCVNRVDRSFGPSAQLLFLLPSGQCLPVCTLEPLYGRPRTRLSALGLKHTHGTTAQRQRPPRGLLVSWSPRRLRLVCCLGCVHARSIAALALWQRPGE